MKKLVAGRERAQIVVITALLLPILLGMSAMAVDIGSYANERRQLQNAADSIALAAAQELPDQAAAEAVAATWADKNNIDVADMTVTVTGGTVEPKVRVTIDRSHEFAFIRALGIDAADVGATARAGKFSLGGGAGVVPWSITQDTVNNSAPGDLVVMKYDTNNNPGQGNFGAIAIDGGGSSDYENAAKYGATSKACAETATPTCTAASCPGTYPGVCGETSGECDGPQCDPKTGNVIGGTRNAVDFRLNYTVDECDTFDEVFSEVTVYANPDGIVVSGGGKLFSLPQAHGKGSHPTYTPTAVPATPTNTSAAPTATATPVAPTATSTPGGPTATSTPAPPTATVEPGTITHQLNNVCNPWAGPNACPTGVSTVECSRRVFIIPVVDDFGNGQTNVTIKRFALMFLEGYKDGDTTKCQGNNCEIAGRFVRADLTTGALSGQYDPNALVHFTRLDE